MQQGVGGARSAGVLYPDPTTGEEKFAYPGGGLLARWMFPGASMVLEGGAANINIFSQSIGPGFGPVVQWPAAAFMPDDPDWGWVRDLVLPFGGDEISTPGDVLDASLPAFASKLVQGFSKGQVDQRLWNNVTADIARAAVAAGERSIDTPDDMQETMEWASGRASLLYLVRGALQSTLPTGPDPKLEVKDPDGAWFSLQVLGQEWRTIRDESTDDYQATQTFVERYGMDPWFIAQPKSRELKERPLSEGGDEWLRRNKDLLDDYDLTLGYVAPDPEGELDFSAYYRTFDEGARAALSDKQQAALARKAKGYMLYNNAMTKADAEGLKGNDLTEWRSLVKASIEEELPGWQNPVLGVPEGANREQKIGEIERMAADPRLRDNPAVEAARLYTQRRREVSALADERGYSTLGGQDVEDLRQYLRQAGSELAADVPEFAGMWREVFSREVEE